MITGISFFWIPIPWSHSTVILLLPDEEANAVEDVDGGMET
jgi:hypothetical protein